jgi:hypothetical protein
LPFRTGAHSEAVKPNGPAMASSRRIPVHPGERVTHQTPDEAEAFAIIQAEAERAVHRVATRTRQALESDDLSQFSRGVDCTPVPPPMDISWLTDIAPAAKTRAALIDKQALVAALYAPAPWLLLTIKTETGEDNGWFNVLKGTYRSSPPLPSADVSWSSEAPLGWQRAWSASAGRWYYWQPERREARWELEDVGPAMPYVVIREDFTSAAQLPPPEPRQLEPAPMAEPVVEAAPRATAVLMEPRNKAAPPTRPAADLPPLRSERFPAEMLVKVELEDEPEVREPIFGFREARFRSPSLPSGRRPRNRRKAAVKDEAVIDERPRASSSRAPSADGQARPVSPARPPKRQRAEAEPATAAPAAPVTRPSQRMRAEAVPAVAGPQAPPLPLPKRVVLQPDGRRRHFYDTATHGLLPGGGMEPLCKWFQDARRGRCILTGVASCVRGAHRCDLVLRGGQCCGAWEHSRAEHDPWRDGPLRVRDDATSDQ